MTPDCPPPLGSHDEVYNRHLARKLLKISNKSCIINIMEDTIVPVKLSGKAYREVEQLSRRFNRSMEDLMRLGVALARTALEAQEAGRKPHAHWACIILSCLLSTA